MTLPYTSVLKARYAFYVAWDDVETLLSLIQGMLMQAILEQESRIAGFKGEVAKSQELHLASLSRDTERLTNSLEKMRAEIKWASRPCILLTYRNHSCQSVACMHACITWRQCKCAADTQPGIVECTALKQRLSCMHCIYFVRQIS